MLIVYPRSADHPSISVCVYVSVCVSVSVCISVCVCVGQGMGGGGVS